MEATGVLQREKRVKMFKICKIYALNGLIFENMDIGLSGTQKHTSLHASQKFLYKYLLKRRKPNINSFTYNATDLQ